MRFTSNTVQAVGVGSTTFAGLTDRNTVTPPTCPALNQANPGGNGSVCDLTISSPVNGQVFAFSTNYNSGIVPLNANSNCSTSQVRWAITFNYESTDGTRHYSSSTVVATSTLGQANNWPSPAGMGGQGSLSVSDVFNGKTLTKSWTTFLDGTNIPSASVTSRLVSLYSTGARPHPLTGIAMVESSYHQFTSRVLYQVLSLWPLEDYLGGSHVGLMQMPNGMPHAFDWFLRIRLTPPRCSKPSSAPPPPT